jgi:hypothetical protein
MIAHQCIQLDVAQAGSALVDIVIVTPFLHAEDRATAHSASRSVSLPSECQITIQKQDGCYNAHSKENIETEKPDPTDLCHGQDMIKSG